MGVWDIVKSGINLGLGNTVAGSSKKPHPNDASYMKGFRPVENNPYSSFNSDAAKIPNVPLGFKFCYDLYNYNDVVRTIVRTLVGETFRNGIVVKERFIMKCNNCKYEYDSEVDKCKNCGTEADTRAFPKSKGFRRPDQDEKRDLEEKLKDVNLNDETILDVLTAIAIDVNVIDNAFLVCRKEYGFNSQGEVVFAKVKEIIRGAPIALKLIQNIQGRYGRTDDDKYVLFCLEHRTKKYELAQEELEDHKKTHCPDCGLRMYPAYYVYDQTGYVTPVRSGIQKVYFTNGEILHFKKFSHGVGYGFPPILSIWIKALILMKMDWFILQAYNLQRPPKGMLVMKANRDSVAKSWEKVKDEARQNPYMIYPLIIEPDGNKDTKTIAEWVDFSFKSEDVDMIEYRNELRRAIGALWGVSPLFQADTSTGVGLANEGLQLTVTNRAVESEQKMFNEKILEWLVKQFGVTDWKLSLNPNEEKDQTARLQRENMRINNAVLLLNNFGIKPKVKTGEDGIEFEFDQPPEMEQLVLDIKAFAVANGIQVNEEQLRMMLSGQDVMGAGEMQENGENIPSEEGGVPSKGGMGGGGGAGAPGSVVGITNGKGGIDPQDGRSEMNQQGKLPHNQQGNNEKNPLKQGGGTNNDAKPKPEGSPDSGRPRGNDNRFGGMPSGARKPNKKDEEK